MNASKSMRQIQLAKLSAARSAVSERTHRAVGALVLDEKVRIEGVLLPVPASAVSITVFKFANELFKPGPLSDVSWIEAVDELSTPGAGSVVQYVAFYKYVATISNGFDVKVPTSKDMST